jgi:hypothetical protein
MTSVRICISALALVLSVAVNVRAQAAPTPPPPPAPVQPASAPDPGWEVEIAPIYVWAPISINSIDLPEFPGLPSPPGGDSSRSTDAALNGAMMAAFRVEKNRLVVRGNFVWAGLSGEVDRPFLKVSGDVILGELQAGFEVARHLYVEGGVRRLAVDVEAELDGYPKVSRKPGVWDPIVGATYRVPVGSHWLLTLHGDGGGFGVGSEVDLAANLTLDWRATRHFGLTFGYGLQYFRLRDTLLDGAAVDDTLELGTTLHGPILGLKLLF